MVRIVLAFALSACLAASVAAQPVQVAPLAAPDSFSVPGRPTGLAETLWQGSSVELQRTVLPMLAAKPLSPAAAALARRVLATGARGPDGAEDPALLALRANALLALGDSLAAAEILQRAPGLERNADLSRAAAESALLAGDDTRACAIERALGVGREAAYWLRLRAFCQAQAGETAQAQLTYDLAQAQARDAVFGRLMAAGLGAGAAGEPSLRNGLDYALSRSLGLDLSRAPASPVSAGAREPEFNLASLSGGVAELAQAIAGGQAMSEEGASALIAAAAEADAKSRARLQGQALLIAALKPRLTPDDRRRLAAFAAPEGKAPAARNLAVEDAAGRKLPGETALIALWTAADAGAAGPALADRVRIVHALAEAGLETDARAFALEGLATLK
ncbi:hypothetical protein [Phenylobacterium sp.]|jgi:hypothetical protein|uniref:hypothetical protein n=1 Tax=Phenylobacterium sp. TaxID=1871053 RepID=UPI002F92B1F2